MNKINKIDNQSHNRNALIGDIKLDNKCSHTTVIWSDLDIEPKWEDVFGDDDTNYPFKKDDREIMTCSASCDIHISFLQQSITENTENAKFKFMYLFNHKGK